jgi:hypothetical protein
MCKAERAVAVVRWMRSSTVYTSCRAGVRLCGYTLSSIVLLGMVVRSANAAALSSRATAGVMLLKASSTLNSLWFERDCGRCYYNAKDP